MVLGPPSLGSSPTLVIRTMTPVRVCVCVWCVRESVCARACIYNDMESKSKRRAESLQEDSFLTSRGVSMARDIGVTYE